MGGALRRLPHDAPFRGSDQAPHDRFLVCDIARCHVDPALPERGDVRLRDERRIDVSPEAKLDVGTR
jgi:hypothetical protein